MEILLVEDVAGVGDIGDMVNVKPGYARNFLIPNGFAIEAKAGSSKTIKHKITQINAKKKRLKDVAIKASEDWKTYGVTLTLRVGSGGKTFGSIGTKDIADALLAQKNIEIDRRRVLLPEPIRKLGRHTVGVKLHTEVNATFTVLVEATQATEEEEKIAAEQARMMIEQNSKKKQAKKAQTEEISEEATEES